MADVLVIEDAPEMALLLETSLTNAGHHVTCAANGSDGLDMARVAPRDVVLLDLNLPDIEGFEVCRRLRGFSDSYVLMVTSRDSVDDKLGGLAVGADDYVTKPFVPSEVVARVEAMMRRPRRMMRDTSSAPLWVDHETHTITVRGEDVRATKIEFEIMSMLWDRRGRVVTRDELITQIWGRPLRSDHHVVDVHVANLRRKLAEAADSLVTVRGVGFRLSP